jgi:hypothetical protein
MSKTSSVSRFRRLVLAATVALPIAAAGCQVHIGGQTLPSPYYTQDDVQYFPAGNEFYLSNEAAAMRARQAELQGPAEVVGARPGYAAPGY